jgi:predicted nucleotidyltransferase component of viral defense system
MNWEKSSASTPLKRDFLKAFFEREKRFFLTGGSALALFYLDHRKSYDLDLFSTHTIEWLEIDGWVKLCAQNIKAELEVVRDAPTFRRYRLVREPDAEVVDIVLDVTNQMDDVKADVDGIMVDTMREIMVNKITTLIGRAEIKDIVDLFFLEKNGLRIEDHFEQAKLKDGGLDAGMMAMILDSIKIAEAPDYMIKPVTLAELNGYIHALKTRFLLMAHPDN